MRNLARASYAMSKAQILEGLTKLTASDHPQIFAQVAKTREADLLNGGLP